MGFSAGKNLQNNINITETQKLSNKTLDNSNLIDGSPIKNSTITGASIESPERIQLKQYDDLASAQADISNRNGGELIYVNDIKKTFQVNDDGLGTKTLAEISGGQGGVNYIENSDFEQGVDGYTDDTNFTISQTDELVAEVLRGAASAKLSKAAVDASNEEISVPFTVSRADLAKKLTISFEYDASDPNYADNDILIGVRQDPNGTPSVIRINGEDLKGGKGTHYAQFQTDASQKEYELFFKVNSTNASAYNVIIDDVKVGPREVVKGAAMTDWVDFTPTGSWTNNTTYNGQYRRVGDSAEIRYRVSLDGAPDSVNLEVNLPAGLSLDTTKFTESSEFALVKFGSGVWRDSAAGGGEAHVFNRSSSSYDFSLAYPADNTASATNEITYSSIDFNSPRTFGLGDSVEFVVTNVPIQGWSSNAVTSEDLGGREVVVRGKGNSGAAISANTERIDFTVIEDTTSNWFNQSGNGDDSFAVPETGYYLISGSIYASSSPLSVTISAYVNGSSNIVLGRYDSEPIMPFNGVIKLTKGDILDIRTGDTFTLGSSTLLHYIHIQKLASPQTILETETVAARYTSNAGQSIGTADTDIKYEDLVLDTHNAYDTSTGVYTVPVSGWYKVDAKWFGGAAAYSVGNSLTAKINIDGTSVDAAVTRIPVTASISYAVAISTSVYIEKGQELKITGSSSQTTNLNTTASFNTFSIARIK